MKKALVTGAAGFIGANVCHQLLKQEIEVVGIDNLNDYYDPKLKKHRVSGLEGKSGFQFKQMDIENAEMVQQLFKTHKFDVVYNLAARAGVRYSLVNPTVYFTTNTLGSLNLLQAMVNANVSKFVLASTSSLYAGEPIPFSEDLPVNRPISPYAASKKAAEQIAYTYHYHYKIDATVVRYFTVFGPAGRPDMSIFRFVYWIDRGMPVEMFGDGEQTRDFTYVDDIASGTILAGRPLGYEIINLGGGKTPVSLNQMIRLIEKGLGKKANVIRKPAQKADLVETQADIRKASQLLNWQPQISFEEGIERTIKWYQENKSLIDALVLNDA